MMTRLIGLISLMFLTSIAIGQDRKLPADTMVKTTHNVTIGGERIAYTAETGTQPVWNDKGKTIAALYYTYYTRDNINDRAARPLVISFNGGPGSASVWMHLAYTGPRILKICLLYTSPSPRDQRGSRMPSSA